MIFLSLLKLALIVTADLIREVASPSVLSLQAAIKKDWGKRINTLIHILCSDKAMGPTTKESGFDTFYMTLQDSGTEPSFFFPGIWIWSWKL